jgi:hypothetical protein
MITNLDAAIVKNYAEQPDVGEGEANEQSILHNTLQYWGEVREEHRLGCT